MAPNAPLRKHSWTLPHDPQRHKPSAPIQTQAPWQARRPALLPPPSSAPSASAASPFSSVKLPAALVQQAKQAAQPLRRSVVGQIEYWATLGRVVEHSGLTVQEAQTAIEGYEAAARKVFLASKTQQTAQADALIDRFMAVEADGSLAQRVRDVVADNRSRAHKKKAA